MPNRKIKKRKRVPKELVRANGVKVKHPTSKTCWHPIEGYEGYYEVSTTGKVRSLPRTITYKSGKKVSLKGQPVTPSEDKDGYLLVHLYKGNKNETFKAVEFPVRPCNRVGNVARHEHDGSCGQNKLRRNHH